MYVGVWAGGYWFCLTMIDIRVKISFVCYLYILYICVCVGCGCGCVRSSMPVSMNLCECGVGLV